MVPVLISCSETTQLSHSKEKKVYGTSFVSQVWTEDLVSVEDDDQNETVDEDFHFDTCSVIVFYLAWLNCNTFSVHTFLCVACGGGKTNLHFFGSFFSTHVLCVKMSVIQAIASISWEWERTSCVLNQLEVLLLWVVSYLGKIYLHGCDVPLPDQTASSQCRTWADNNVLCLEFVIHFCFSVHCTVIEECFHFLKLLFC